MRWVAANFENVGSHKVVAELREWLHFDAPNEVAGVSATQSCFCEVAFADLIELDCELNKIIWRDIDWILFDFEFLFWFGEIFFIHN